MSSGLRVELQPASTGNNNSNSQRIMPAPLVNDEIADAERRALKFWEHFRDTGALADAADLDFAHHLGVAIDKEVCIGN